MGRKSNKVWQTIRHYYEKNIGTVAEICAEFEVTKGAFYYRVQSEGWSKRARRGSGNAGRPKAAFEPGKPGAKNSMSLSEAGAGGTGGEPACEHGCEKGGEDGAPTVGERLFEVLLYSLYQICDLAHFIHHHFGPEHLPLDWI